MASFFEKSVPSMRKHEFQKHNYMSPAFCAHCGKLLKGLVKQGLQCKRCEVNVHKKCKDELQKQCIELIVGNHHFIQKTYTSFTYCNYCEKLLVGVVNQGLQCSECKINVHKDCQEKVEIACVDTARRLSLQTSQPQERVTTEGRSHRRESKLDEKISFAAINQEVSAPKDYESLFEKMPVDSEAKSSDDEGAIKSEPPKSVYTKRKKTLQSAILEDQVQQVTEVMIDNVAKLHERGENLDNLQDKSTDLVEQTKHFKNQAVKLKDKFWWENKKMWIIIGVAVAILVVIIVVLAVLKS